jgi:hypothetical protein
MAFEEGEFSAAELARANARGSEWGRLDRCTFDIKKPITPG